MGLTPEQRLAIEYACRYKAWFDAFAFQMMGETHRYKSVAEGIRREREDDSGGVAIYPRFTLTSTHESSTDSPLVSRVGGTFLDSKAISNLCERQVLEVSQDEDLHVLVTEVRKQCLYEFLSCRSISHHDRGKEPLHFGRWQLALSPENWLNCIMSQTADDGSEPRGRLGMSPWVKGFQATIAFLDEAVIHLRHHVAPIIGLDMTGQRVEVLPYPIIALAAIPIPLHDGMNPFDRLGVAQQRHLHLELRQRHFGKNNVQPILDKRP